MEFLLLWVFRSRLKLHQFKTILSFLPPYWFLLWTKGLRKIVIHHCITSPKRKYQRPGAKDSKGRAVYVPPVLWIVMDLKQHLPAHGLFTWAASERFCSPENVQEWVQDSGKGETRARIWPIPLLLTASSRKCNCWLPLAWSTRAKIPRCSLELRDVLMQLLK